MSAIIPPRVAPRLPSKAPGAASRSVVAANQAARETHGAQAGRHRSAKRYDGARQRVKRVVGRLARGAAVGWVLAWGEPSAALAETQPATLGATAPLTVRVKPVLGEQAPCSNGTTTYAVTVDNSTDAAVSAHVYLTPARGLFRDPRVDDAFSLAPLWLPANGRVTVEMVAHGPASTAVDGVILDGSGNQLGRGQGYSSSPGSPHVLSISRSARVANRLEGVELPPLNLERNGDQPELPALAQPQAPAAELTIRATRPERDVASGSLVVPSSSAGYAPTTLVIADSEQLVGLSATQLHALAGWVLLGGNLAINPTREEDLQHPTLVRLLGGSTRPAPPQQTQLDPQPLRVVDKPTRSQPQPVTSLLQVEVPDALRSQLRGFVGGNLHPSPWGASASYGLGEVTLLGFDSNLRSIPGEPWLDLQLLDLVGHGWDRRRLIAIPHAAGETRGLPGYSIREFLKRNSQRHWAISAAAVLLIGYAVLAGPVNFRRSSRKREPLTALRNLLLLSVGALLAVLTLGAVSRGTSDRARHLTLLDAAAGMPVAAATRFRAIQASTFDDVVVRQTEAGSNLSVMNDDDGMNGDLLLQGDEMRLQNLHGKPWQTLYVREDSLAPVGRGVSLLHQPDGTLTATNRVGRDLTAVLLKDADGRLAFFPHIADGQSVTFSSGQRVEYTEARAPSGATPLLVHQFDVMIDEVAPGAAQAWDAIEDLRQGEADWWPQDVPVLLAQVVGGEGNLLDSGIEVDSDRVMLRVMGFGGTP